MDVRKHLSVENIFIDFKGRRNGIVKALTEDMEKFFKMCDPGKEGLCLFGYPNGSWEVKFPVKHVPTDLPEPVLGINICKEILRKKDWTLYVAAHSDAWLLALASFLGANNRFGKKERERLFRMINELPTITEVVKEEKLKNERRHYKGKESNSRIKMPKSKKMSSKMSEKGTGGEEEEYDEENYLCAACGEQSSADMKWIKCDTCATWLHQMCVNVTSEEATYIKEYMCPYCRNSKRLRV